MRINRENLEACGYNFDHEIDNFGFVRDINEDLFINNTEYHEDMSHDSWRPLSDLL